MTQLRPPDAGRQQPLGSWALATTLITLLVLLVGALMPVSYTHLTLPTTLVV